MFFYDSDGSDDYYMMMGRWGNLDPDDYMMYGGWNEWETDYSSDDYGGFDDYYGSSDSDESFVSSSDHSNFQDPKHFSAKIRCRINIMEESYGTNTLEHLWENLLYLRDLVDIGHYRSKHPLPEKFSCDSIKNIKGIYENSARCFSKIPQNLVILANNWFMWCNDLFIDTLQSLIPVGFPYTVWENIMKCLSSSNTYRFRELTTKISALSEDDSELRVIEGNFLEFCTDQCIELNKLLYKLLYTEKLLSKREVELKLSRALALLNTSLGRLASFLVTSVDENITNIHSSRYLKYRMNKLNTDFDDLTESTSEELCMRNIYQANPDFRYPSPYFTYLVKDYVNEESLHQLISINVNELNSDCHSSHKAFKTNLKSISPPAVFASGHIIACTYTPKKNKLMIGVWDRQADHEKPFSFCLANLEKSMNKKVDRFSVSLDNVHNVGLTKVGGVVKVALSLTYKTERVDEQLRCTHILDIRTNKPPKSKHPKLKWEFEDSHLLACHKNFMFVVTYGLDRNPMLCTHDISQHYKVTSSMSWDNTNPWNIRFNSNTDRDTFLLYRGKEFQIRKLDGNLSFVKDIHIDIEPNLWMGDTHFQMYNDMVYGYHCSDPALHRGEGLIEEEFVIDTAADKIEAVHFNLLEERSDNEELKLTWTSFNEMGQVVKMVMYGDFHTLHDPDSSPDEYSLCCEVKFTSIGFLDSFNDVVDDMRDDAKKTLAHLKERAKQEAERQRKEVERIEEKKKNLEKFMLEREKREADEEAARKKRVIEQEAARKKREIEKEAARKKKEMELEVKRRDHLTRYRVQLDRIQKYIDSSTTFTATINIWKQQNGGYGFAKIHVDGYDQDVWVPRNAVKSIGSRSQLRSGLKICFEITWNDLKPRPKAINVVIQS